jgi:Tfp pilus assembly protein PilN
MFTIDLLKGQAIPLKSKPGSLAIIALSVAIPITIAAGMFSFYQHNKVVLSVKEQEIAKCQGEIDKLSDAVNLQKALEKEKTAYSSCLSEVKSSIKRHTQWSPVLTTIMENLPESVVLSSLEVVHNSVKKKVPKEDNPKKMVEVDVLVRTLRLGVVGDNKSDSDEAVRNFRDRLRSSKFLGPKLENIGVSQKSETREGRDVVSYEISCVFKEGF